jgi:transcriptional regulator with XRE-family HTH domain/Zn-dependent peptidase ImmA (M78 family)
MVTDTTSAGWTAPGYSDVRRAVRVGTDLHIEFMNGDVVSVPSTRFGVEGDFEVRFDADDSPAVQLVADSGVRELSWGQIRTATDPDFAQEMRRQDAEESRRIGRRLRALREDRGLSQREVAGLVGMPAPQLSKIESGTYDMRVSTVQTLLRAMGASFADISGPDALDFSQKSLRRAAEKAGVSADLVDRLLSHTPRHLVRRIFSTALGWDLGSTEPATPGAGGLGLNIAFKASKSTGDPASSPLIRLAVACSETVLSVAKPPDFVGMPEASEARRAAADPEGVVTLRSLLDWAWGRGVVVVPLHGRGAFCAAAWSLRDRPVVVLKDSRSSAVFWLFDLGHELGHIACGHVHGDGIVDVDQLGPDESIVDAQEREANTYALELLLGDHAALVESVRRESRGNYLRFKDAVATVAQQANVSPGLLGMVAAYELTEIGQAKDRWGSATNLAGPDGEGRGQVQTALIAQLDTRGMTEEDASLLSAAVLS